ncbi:hypothetical protein [Nostoc favosum]|uniref:Uncharacterized protein n=1 Tax=Nostoc favosum CHAB5714 TaxID=2780399 RepID=A0ABS8IHR1_9NOSO|nr:hypothetical protein [Nostoc favosum]MCC5603805.1 hypothetical protein [Nostoc favosum CHAB5714]
MLLTILGSSRGKKAKLRRQFLLSGLTLAMTVGANSTSVFAQEANVSKSAADIGTPVTLNCDTRLNYFQPDDCSVGEGEQTFLQIPTETIRIHSSQTKSCLLKISGNGIHSFSEDYITCLEIPLE